MWSNTRPTNLIFLKAIKLYLYYYQTCHYWLATFVASRRDYWFAILRQSIIIIIIINANYLKKFYKFWLSC